MTAAIFKGIVLAGTFVRMLPFTAFRRRCSSGHTHSILELIAIGAFRSCALAARTIAGLPASQFCTIIVVTAACRKRIRLAFIRVGMLAVLAHHIIAGISAFHRLRRSIIR
jgi:hypothetical protein